MKRLVMKRLVMKRFLILLGFLPLLGACTQYSLIEPERVEIGGAYSVDSQISWSKQVVGKTEIWTVDGPGLEAVQFFKGLEDGDTLYKPLPDEDLPVFESDMRASEVMEFVVDSLSRRGAAGIEASGLRPETFGSVPGYRFDLTFQTTDGLMMRGMAFGAVIEEELQLILYTGTRTYYFDRYEDRVEDLFASIETI